MDHRDLSKAGVQTRRRFVADFLSAVVKAYEDATAFHLKHPTLEP